MGTEETSHIKVQSDDFSFIYTVIQLLYNLNHHTAINANLDYSNAPLFSLLNKIFKEDDKNVCLEKNTKLIYKIITEHYKLKIGDSPGKILIQILEILNYEENGHKVNDVWEKSILNNQNLFWNSFNLKQSYNDFDNHYKKYNRGIISKLFHGYYLTKRSFPNFNNNIMHFFNYYSVYELNISYVYRSLNSNGKSKAKISLFDCIKFLKERKIENFYCPCFVCHLIYTLPHFLIFFITKEENNNNFYGDIVFEKECDFSSMIYQNNNNNNNKYKYNYNKKLFNNNLKKNV
jgi:hypothetical protein